MGSSIKGLQYIHFYFYLQVFSHTKPFCDFLSILIVVKHRWEDNIRMDLEQIDINTGNWVDLAQDRDYWRALLNAALTLQVP